MRSFGYAFDFLEKMREAGISGSDVSDLPKRFPQQVERQGDLIRVRPAKGIQLTKKSGLVAARGGTGDRGRSRKSGRDGLDRLGHRTLRELRQATANRGRKAQIFRDFDGAAQECDDSTGGEGRGEVVQRPDLFWNDGGESSPGGGQSGRQAARQIVAIDSEEGAAGRFEIGEGARKGLKGVEGADGRTGETQRGEHRGSEAARGMQGDIRLRSGGELVRDRAEAAIGNREKEELLPGGGETLDRLAGRSPFPGRCAGVPACDRRELRTGRLQPAGQAGADPSGTDEREADSGKKVSRGLRSSHRATIAAWRGARKVAPSSLSSMV